MLLFYEKLVQVFKVEHYQGKFLKFFFLFLSKILSLLFEIPLK